MLEDRLRILGIGAHPDDCEGLMGGTAIKYRRLGYIVKFVSTTNGDTGHYDMGGSKLARVRAEEIRGACGLFGIESEILDIHSNQLETDILTREKIICLIRQFQPDIIFTHRLNDYHPDHRRTSILVQDSAYAVRIPNVCPLTPFLRYSPIIMYMVDNFKKPTEFVPTVVVDIDDAIDVKIQMLHCHRSQMYEWLPWMDDKLDEVPKDEGKRLKWLKDRWSSQYAMTADRFRKKLIEEYGLNHGPSVKYAEAFELSEYGGQLLEEKIGIYFPFLNVTER